VQGARHVPSSGKLVPHRLPHSTTAAREITERETPAFGSRCANPRTGVYPPLPCWSGAVTRGLYRGRGRPTTRRMHPRHPERRTPHTTPDAHHTNECNSCYLTVDER
jgi:hypothetical protein